jgi:hypothetical protein
LLTALGRGEIVDRAVTVSELEYLRATLTGVERGERWVRLGEEWVVWR